MSDRQGQGGSRYLYAPFDVASVRMDAQERILDERLAALNFRLVAIEESIQRVERRLWLAMFGLVSVVVAEIARDLLLRSVSG